MNKYYDIAKCFFPKNLTLFNYTLSSIKEINWRIDDYFPKNILHWAIAVNAGIVADLFNNPLYQVKDKDSGEYLINVKDESGNTPLHIALLTAASGRIRHIENTQNIVQWLLDNENIDLSIKNNSGQTPLELARSISVDCHNKKGIFENQSNDDAHETNEGYAAIIDSLQAKEQALEEKKNQSIVIKKNKI